MFAKISDTKEITGAISDSLNMMYMKQFTNTYSNSYESKVQLPVKS